MCSSCTGAAGHHASSPRARRLTMVGTVAVIVAGAVSGVIVLASLLAHGVAPALVTQPSASVLEIHGGDLLTGRSLEEALRGRAAVIEFWASGCSSCRQVADRLQRLAATNHSPAFVGIDVGDTRADARAVLRSLGWRYLSIADPRARLVQPVGLRALPTTLLLDRRHRVVLRVIGLSGLPMLERRLAQFSLGSARTRSCHRCGPVL